MKTLTRTIIVLVVLSLVMGNLAPAQAESKAEGAAEPTAQRRVRRPTPPKPPPTAETEPPSVEPPEPIPSKTAPGAPTPPAPPTRMGNPTISGRTGLGGVMMYGLPGNVVTDQNGYYSATVEHGWSGKVMPVREGFSFEPASMTYTKVTTHRSNDDYTSKLITYTISGEVGVGGVLMKGLPGNPVVTGRNGTYQATVEYGWSGTVKPTKKGYAFEPPNLSYSRVIHDQNNQNYNPKRIGPAPMLGRTGGRKVLVIPDTNVKVEDLVEITQDLLVMSHILDERFREPRTIKRVFTDFGDFFGRNNRSTETIYMQGYGVVFLMEVNFAFSPPLISEEQKDKETAEDVDPTWQRARQQIFSPKTPMPGFSEQGPGLVKFDQFKKELIETLKHAANIRNLTPDEWIILTVIGQGRQPGEFYEDYYRSAAPRSRTPRDRRSSRGEAEGGGMVGGMSMGMGGMGMMGGMGGMGGGMGGYGGGMMGGMGGMAGYGEMMGGMAGYGEMGLPSATVLTIRAKKSDVGDFARGELDFEEFQEMVEIFNY